LILKDVVLSASVGSKAFGLSTEPQRDAYWRAFEEARQPFYTWVALLVQRQFRAESATVVANYRGSSDEQTMWESIRNQWRLIFRNIYASVASDFGQRTLTALPQKGVDPLSTKANVAWVRAMQQYVIDHAGDHVAGITETTRDNLKEAILEGIDAGESPTQIAKRIQTAYDGFSAHRALTIARTEVVRASNAASQVAATSRGFAMDKQWLATPDERTRSWHAAADGQRVSLEEPFIVNGEELMFPGDDSRGASANNLINCRCTEVFFPAAR
jgi:SPP1 gp7 family putative phage head morphogenesis protein